jgi:multidrug transporter EmrE-like cation transporter
MIWLILSIVSSVCIYTVFKLTDRWNIPLFPVILVNYATCILMGLLFLQPDLASFQLLFSQPWFWKLPALGILFIVIFVCMGLTTAYFGVGTTSVAAKMALIVPSLYFIIADSSLPAWYFWPGLILSFPAIFLLAFSGEKSHRSGLKYIAFPLLVWIGSGVIDTLLKVLETEMSEFPNKQLWQSTLIFSGAFVSGLIILIFRHKKSSVSLGRILSAGVLLGVPNFGSILFLLFALSGDFLKPSILFPVNNLGIVFVSVWVSILWFKEPINNRKVLGFVIAILSIVLLSFSHVI